MEAPLVSVIVPAYNAERFLAETLGSLQAQTLTDWEALVVDDGSCDRTAEIAERFAADDARLQVFRRSNAGVSATRNFAAAQARGTYLAFLDADDLWAPSKLAEQVAAFAAEDVDVVFCSLLYFESDPSQMSRPSWPEIGGLHCAAEMAVKLAGEPFLIPSCVMLRASLLKEVGGFDQSFAASEDWDLWLRLCAAGSTFWGVDKPLCLYRQHATGLSKQWALCALSHVAIVERHFPPGTPLRERVDRFARLSFRNVFTLQGDLGCFEGLDALFESYRQIDRGYASRFMSVLRAALPFRLFWFVSRYGVIPLAWHLEGLTKRLKASPEKTALE